MEAKSRSRHTDSGHAGPQTVAGSLSPPATLKAAREHVTWAARNAGDSDARRAIVFALFISDGIACVVALIGQLREMVNALGWSTVAIYLLLAVGFAYFRFTKPAEA